MLVYKITNVVNDRVYIGSSKDFTARKKQHIEDLFNKRHHNHKLQKDFDKYGIQFFKFEILKHFKNQKDMLIYEYQTINATDNKYNILTKDYTLGVSDASKNEKVVVQKSRVLIVLKKDREGDAKTRKDLMKRKKKLGLFEAQHQYKLSLEQRRKKE